MPVKASDILADFDKQKPANKTAPEKSNVTANDILGEFDAVEKKNGGVSTSAQSGLSSAPVSPTQSTLPLQSGNKLPNDPFDVSKLFTNPTFDQLDPVEKKDYNMQYPAFVSPEVSTAAIKGLIEKRKDPAVRFSNAQKLISDDMDANANLFTNVDQSHQDKFKEQILQGDGADSNINVGRYFHQRSDELDKQIKDLQGQQYVTPAPDILIPAGLASEPAPNFKELQAQIDQLSAYKKSLFKSTNTLTAYQAVKEIPLPVGGDINSNKDANRKVGLKMQELSSPIAAENKRKNIESSVDAKRHPELVDVENYRLESDGLAARQFALDADKNLGNITHDEWLAQSNAIANQSKQLFDLHPEAKKVAIAQAMGQVIQQNREARDAKIPLLVKPGSVWENVVNYGISESDIQAAGKQMGLSDADIKTQINNKDDIPGTSFLANVYNKFVVHSGEDLVAPIASLLTKGRLRTDAEVESQRYAKDQAFQFNAGQQFNQPGTVIDTKKSIKENGKTVDNPDFLQQVANPNEGHHNWGYGSLNGVGDALGTLGQLWLTTELTGGLGDAALGSTIGAEVIGVNRTVSALSEVTAFTAKQKALFGNVTGMMLTGYNENKAASKEFIGEKEGSEAAQNLYAITRSMETGLLFGMGFAPQTLIAKAFGRAESQAAAKEFADLIPNGVEKLSEKSWGDYLKNNLIARVGIEGLKENTKAATMMAIDQAVGIGTQAMFNPQSVDAKNLGHDLLNTGIHNFLTFAPISFFGAAVSALNSPHLSQSRLEQEAIYRAGLDPVQYKEYVNDQVVSGTIQQGEADKRIQLVNSMSEIQKGIPEDLSRSEKIEFANNLLYEKKYQKEIEGLKSQPLIARKEAQIKQLQDRQEQILSNSTGVDVKENGQPVIQSENKKVSPATTMIENKRLDLANIDERINTLDPANELYDVRKKALESERSKVSDYYDERIKQLSNNEILQNETANNTNTQTKDAQGKTIENTTALSDSEKAKTATGIKKGVDDVFKENPDLSKIGTKEEYSEYLDSVFPESKSKDIVYHRSKDKFDEFDFSKVNKDTGGGFDFAKTSGATQYGDNLHSVLLNIKEFKPSYERTSKTDGTLTPTLHDGDIYSIYEPDQIHSLGSKKDLDLFRKWKEKNSNKELVVDDVTKKLLEPHKDMLILSEMKTDGEKLKFIAEQAQNISSTGEKMKGDAYLSTVEAFGDKLVTKAIELFPEEKLISNKDISSLKTTQNENVKKTDNANTGATDSNQQKVKNETGQTGSEVSGQQVPIQGQEKVGVPASNVPAPDITGRTPVTLSGLTEPERLAQVDRRKKETVNSAKVKSSNALLEKVDKYNNLKSGVLGKFKPEGLKLLNEINTGASELGYSFNSRSGELKNENGRKVSTNYSEVGDRAIDEKGIVIRDREQGTQDVFNQLLEAGTLPNGYRLDNKRMSPAELDATVEDIINGIPSERANRYLDSLDQSVKTDSYQVGETGNTTGVGLNDLIGAQKEIQTVPLTEENINKWLDGESNLTPEQEQVLTDNFDNLITEYENERTTKPEIKVPKPQSTAEAGANTTDQQNTKDTGNTASPVKEKPTSTGNAKPPVDEPPPNDVSGNEKSGSNELKDMALNIPNDGQLREYASKGTIEKYHKETPENAQGVIVQELTPALQHGEDMIDKAKDVFGEKEYVDKTLQFIEASKLPTQSKALMYISLENDLARQKLLDPNSLDIQKKQDLVRSKSQAFLREASLAINFGKLRKIGEVGYDISKVTDHFFSAKEKEEKAVVEKSIEANADTINKEAEKMESARMDIEQKINEAVESEIAKIHEKLPTERKKKADKAIEALEGFQKKIRSRTYDATLGIPAALVDSGITIIKRAIKAGVAIADAIELGIQHIKEKYGKEWVKEGDFRSDMIAGFRDAGIKKEASGTPNKVIKDALIESGFGREITVNTKNGKEKRTILDWKKLAGEEGSIDKMKENVNNVFEKQGYSKDEISEMQKELAEQYNDLRASVIEHSINELNKRNQKTVTADQKSAARKLSELYNYGLFEKDPAQYDVLLGKAIGIDRLNPERFKQAHELGKALEILYSSKFNGKKLNDLELKTAVQQIEEKMRIILHAEAGQHGSRALQIADMVRTYMDASQRMILNSLGQAVQNPLSGLEQQTISNIDRLFDNSSTKELGAQRRKIASAVYKDMVVNNGVNYGDVNTTFVSRGGLDHYIGNLSDSKIVQGVASTLIGKTTLDAADSYFKSKLTDQKFTYNLIKILSEKRLVDGKMVNGMSKQDAVNYVSEKLTGQSFSDAKKTAKDIINKVNAGGKKIVGDSDVAVDRLANDIVKAALVNGSVITSDQVSASYNAAYKSAGRSLGHVANNPLSEMVQGLSGKIEKKINDAIKEKQYKKAAFLTYQSIFFRNILNPFVGGGTNWVVLKLEKNGLGLASGLYNGGKEKLDLTSETGVKKAEKALFEAARDRDAVMRGAIGGTAALISSLLWYNNVEEFRKWRNKNKWASKYTDNVTPEEVLATVSARNKEMGYYIGTLINKNDAYDKSAKAIRGLDNFSKGKTDKGWGQVGEAVGGNFGVPLPWRLVRDGQNIVLGAQGKEPYKVSSNPSEGFWEGWLKAGMVDYIKNNPANK